MQLLSTLLPLFLGSALAAPAPAPVLDERATQQCGQYQSQSNGAYTLSTNGWGWSSGTGSQCSEINSVSGNTIAWDTTWYGGTRFKSSQGRETWTDDAFYQGPGPARARKSRATRTCKPASRRSNSVRTRRCQRRGSGRTQVRA